MTAGSYCLDFRVVRAFLAKIPLYSFGLPFPRLTMRTPLGLNRPLVLCIGDNSAEELDLGKTGEASDRPVSVVNRVPLAEPPSPSGKGKSKVSRPPDPGPTRLADPNRSPGRDTIYTISIYYTVLGLSLTYSFSELYLYL